MSALKLIDLGYTPLLIAENTKRPLEPFKGRAPPSRDELHWRLRRNSRLNSAIRLEGLLALDADDQAAKEVIRQYETPFIQTTPSGGEHRLFRLPEGLIANCRIKIDGIGFDIKTGANAYILTAPSEIDGRRYELKELVGRDELPILDITHFLKKEEPKKPYQKTGDHIADISKMIETPDLGRVYKYLDKCDVSVQGANGSARFFGACCRVLRAFPWLSWDQFVSAATYYSDHRSDPSWTPSEILHKCQDSWRKERG